MENCLLKELVHSEAKGGKLDTKGIIKKVFKTFLLAKERHLMWFMEIAKIGWNKLKKTLHDIIVSYVRNLSFWVKQKVYDKIKNKPGHGKGGMSFVLIV